ncbi:unnamed protein product, partial [Symbiodinium sp. CCMP2456]
MLDEVESDLSKAALLINQSPDAQNQAKKLYALLTTLLRERPLQLLRSAEQGNGFEGWRILTATLAPASKSRSLALLGAITQFPAMSNANVLEQLLRLEELFRKYQQAAGSEVPKELKSALLLRSLPQSVKTHVSMTCSEDCSYDTLRETVVRWERNTQKWTQSHWGNECWMNNGRVQNVSEDCSTSVPSSSASSVSSSATASVKRVFNLTADDHVPETSIYTIAEDESECGSIDSWWCRVVQCYDLLEQDDDEVIECEMNSYIVHDMTTTDTYSSDLEWLVRGVTQHSEASDTWEHDSNCCEIVLDSGADVSVMPARWLEQGYGLVADSKVRMQDAQGHTMPCQGSRVITLDLGSICVQEQFYASAVSAPLMSLGRLLRQGWSIEQRQGGLCLCNASEEVEIPISFKRNSLVVQASVHLVAASEPEYEVRPIAAERVHVKLNFPLDHVDGEWGFLSCGEPAILTTGMTFVDPSPKMGIQLWRFRTTCIKIGDQWEMCEFQEPLEYCESLEELLPGVIRPVPILTIMTRTEATPDRLGIEILSEFKFKAPEPSEAPEFPEPEVIDIPMPQQEDEPPVQAPAAPPGAMLQGSKAQLFRRRPSRLNMNLEPNRLRLHLLKK